MRNVFSVTVFCFLWLSQGAFAQTKFEMYEEACNNFTKSDNELNTTWRKTIKKYSANKQFINKLRKAEAEWIIYRDKYLESVYNPCVVYTDMKQMCSKQVLQGLTEDRTKDLKLLLNGPRNDRSRDSASDVATLDAEMRKTYQLALHAPSDPEPVGSTYEEPHFAEIFQAAQEAWTSFRNADADAWQELGTSAKERAARRNSRIIELDQARIKQLD